MMSAMITASRYMNDFTRVFFTTTAVTMYFNMENLSGLL